MAKKWLIVNGEFRMSGSVEFHRELLREGEGKKDTQGGGWWELDRETLSFLLYSKSEDFGPAKKEDVLAAIKKYRFPGFMRINKIKFFFSTKEWFSDALKEVEGKDPDWVCQ
jgi:hypothetical protein